MPITVTPGAVDAVAYDSAANADAYFTARGITAWTGTDTVKEQALIKATDYLERRYNGRWTGTRATEAQALAWPRYDVFDVDGYPYQPTEVPVQLKRAMYEAALLILTGTDLEPVLSRGGSVVREKVKAGPVESETEYLGGAPARDVITKIDGLLVGLIGNGARGAGNKSMLRV